MKTRPISPKGVFFSGVFYTRDYTDKDCYIRQECSQQGALRTSSNFSTGPAGVIDTGGKQLEQYQPPYTDLKGELEGKNLSV